MTDARSLWPDALPGRSAEHWGWLAGKLGAGSAYPLARPFLIGIRGVGPHDLETHETVAKPAYDDTFVLLEADGLLPPYVFAGATHAYQLDSKLSPDVNGDGRGDVGTILPGAYVLTLALEAPYPVFTVHTAAGSAEIHCVRDTNHDGRYSPEEYARQGLATAVLLHTGYDAPADSEHRSSIACQTCRAVDLRLLAGKAKRSPGRAIDYRLVTADQVLELLKASSFVEQPEPEAVA